jgi:hypothetical protein
VAPGETRVGLVHLGKSRFLRVDGHIGLPCGGAEGFQRGHRKADAGGSFGFPNWSFQNVTDHDAPQVAAANGRNRQDGYGNAGVVYSVFAHSVPLQAGKTVELVVLPGTAIHIFATAIAP